MYESRGKHCKQRKQADFQKGECFDLSPKTDGNVDPQKFRT